MKPTSYLSRRLVYLADLLTGPACTAVAAIFALWVVHAALPAPYYAAVLAVYTPGFVLLWNRHQLHRRIARHSAYQDYVDIIRCMVILYAGQLLVALVLFPAHVPHVLLVTVLAFYMQTFLLLGMRMMMRLLKDRYAGRKRYRNGFKRVVIFGAGELGLSLKRALEANTTNDYQLVGFLDDARVKTGNIIEGIPVFSARHGLGRLRNKLQVAECIIAATMITPVRKQELVTALAALNIQVKELPPFQQWFATDFNLRGLQELRVEDLLGRSPIQLFNPKLEAEIRGRAILVTGAAGSIGSEIVRRVLQRQPARLICLDSGETPLHQLQLELAAAHPESEIHYVIADVRNKQRLEQVFAAWQPFMVFHAAAYKHVPLMEGNVEEAISTNVLGTKNVADLAVAHQVSRFVLVSTDKAVNPTSIMGASKRMAELYVQALNRTQRTTRLITTRFGNVLGSNGSVVPLFKEQIHKGGPVTVTHPDMVRYFMTIPEACELVLEAGVMGAGGEVFVFDMGAPVRIVDLARSMIRIAGFVPDEEIKIEFTGMRPGEKLYEELFQDHDNMLATHHPKIMIGKVSAYQYEEVQRFVLSLQAHLYQGKETDLSRQLFAFVSKVEPDGDKPAVAPVRKHYQLRLA